MEDYNDLKAKYDDLRRTAILMAKKLQSAGVNDALSLYDAFKIRHQKQVSWQCVIKGHLETEQVELPFTIKKGESP
jgi:hypothetical protein